jgi:FkbM family methyltransferase
MVPNVQDFSKISSLPKSAAAILRRTVGDLSGVARTASRESTFRYLASIAATFPEVLRTRKLAPADAKMAGHPCRFHLFGTAVVLPGELFGGARELYSRGVYFGLPQFRIAPRDVVIDLGANQGILTVLAARIGAKVVAVEAQSGFCRAIQRHAELNSCADRVIVEFGLVGPNSGLFAHRDILVGASHYGAEPPHLSLDALLLKHRIDHVNFLKIDIEGSEFDLFSKDVDWLARVEKLVMEVHPHAGDPKLLREPLLRAGFQIALRSPDLVPVEEITPPGGYLYAWRD